MATPQLSDLDFAQAMARLLPRGIVWRTDQNAVLSRTLKALAPSYTRTTAAAANLLVDASPATTENLLAEWEASLGLPDPCTAASPSIEQRKAAVRAKFASRGSLSAAYFIGLGAAYGNTLTITEYRPWTAGQPCGGPAYGTAWAYAWSTSVSTLTTLYFRSGSSVAGDPLRTYGATELTCRIVHDAPGGTTVFFT